MAEAPGHRLGQIVGEALEFALEPVLSEVANRHSLYLDKHGPRPVRRGSKLTWTDRLGNAHDLDYVLERGGTDRHVGMPVAFIEAAWRRYTKHSRNKAQELQGALLPLMETHWKTKPFAGAIVGGVWSDDALQQLVSSDIHIVHLPYERVIDAFGQIGMDVQTDERTPDHHLQRQVDRYASLNQTEVRRLGALLREEVSAQVDDFRDALVEAITRKISQIAIVALYGEPKVVHSIDEARDVLEAAFDDLLRPNDGELHHVDMRIDFTNGDEIRGQFGDAASARAFLEAIRTSLG